MARTGPFEFIQQVRTEAGKVTWPSRKETLITTVMVVIMAIAAGIFFLLADQAISRIVTFILGLGR